MNAGSQAGSPRGGPVRPPATMPVADTPAERFLEELGRTGNPSGACRVSGMTRRQVRALREDDPVFDAACDDAMDDAADMLEAEARRRALDGVSRPMTKNGETVMVQHYSDPLLVLLLRGCKPEKFKPRASSAPAADPRAAIREIATDYDPPRAASGPSSRTCQ